MTELVAWLRRAGVERGEQAGLVVAPGTVAVAAGAGRPAGAVGPAVWTGADVGEIGLADAELRPRWVVWSGATAAACVAGGVRLATCWDIAAVHRMLFGGWRADAGLVWARLHGLDAGSAPAPGSAPDLFDLSDDSDDPVDTDGLLRPSWVNGGWAERAGRPARWASLAIEVAALQRAALAKIAVEADRPMTVPIAASESAAELLCAELSHDGLPVNRTLAEELLGQIIGPRPRSDGEALRQRTERDRRVLRHAPEGTVADLRSPAQVLALLRRVDIEVPDTRAHRLRELKNKHPLVDALLEWRKAERIATTYGYGWLDAQLGPDGRLRGEWTGCDGAAGRMTASAGLHNMPAVLRAAVVAEPGQVFVRADLGQIEPRVLAAVSGDAALAAATQSDDLYAPVAAALGVDRPTAKVAVLGAMYGQTTGHGAQALRRLKAAYPVAMAYLDAGDRAGQAGRDLRTYGGRLVSMRVGDGETPARAAARGRYGRNALVQGAAAEFFKMWAVTVRARAAELDARIVLCLHDELLIHAPEPHGEAVAKLVNQCLLETARRWAPGTAVRFIADTRVLTAWSEAKEVLAESGGLAGPPAPPARRASGPAVPRWYSRRSVLVVFLVRVVRLSPGVAGILLALTSLGGVAGAVLARRMASRFGTARAVVLGKILLLPAGLLIPLASRGLGLALFVLGSVTIIGAIIAGNIIWSGWVQTYYPARILGRVSTSVQVFNYGAIPLGAVLAGLLASHLGVRATLWIMLGGLVASSFVLLAGPLPRLRDLPSRDGTGDRMVVATSRL